MENRGTPPGTPRWVKVCGAIAAIVMVVLVALVHLHGMSGMRGHY